MTFIAELRRRNVIRTAGLYLVGTWLLLTQVSSTVLPTFDVPSWVLRALIIVLAIDFDRVIARDPTYSPAHSGRAFALAIGDGGHPLSPRLRSHRTEMSTDPHVTKV